MLKMVEWPLAGVTNEGMLILCGDLIKGTLLLFSFICSGGVLHERLPYVIIFF